MSHLEENACDVLPLYLNADFHIFQHISKFLKKVKTFSGVCLLADPETVFTKLLSPLLFLLASLTPPLSMACEETNNAVSVAQSSCLSPSQCWAAPSTVDCRDLQTQ